MATRKKSEPIKYTLSLYVKHSGKKPMHLQFFSKTMQEITYTLDQWDSDKFDVISMMISKDSKTGKSR